MYRQLFPLGKAYGQAFCNREEITGKLISNIEGGKHSLLLAPRRFGKSSVAERAIEKTNYPFVRINFHLCTSETEVSQLIVENVTKLIGSAIGQIEKIMTSIKKYLSNLEPLISFGENIASLKLMPKGIVNHAVIIAEALLLIEKLLKEKNKRAVIFFDEFQEIARINDNQSLEGAFRTAAQEMSHLAIIFSGSIRSLLLSMFEDENRPLYKLCRKIKLNRITAIAYEKHIQAIAEKTWGAPLENVVFSKIMELSHRHPYYVNYLCDSVWEICKNKPTITDVQKAWDEVIREEWSDALKEISDLPVGQRRLLKYIANYNVKNLQSQETCQELSMPSSSIGSAIHVLIEKDYIEKDIEDYYQVINPLLYAILRGAKD